MDPSKTLAYCDVYDEETNHYLQQEFTRLKDECYLDHAGATLYSNSQIKEISDNLLSTIYANPHSAGIASSFTHDSIEGIRYRLLEHFHTTSDDYSIIFTSGATASLKLVAETFNFQNGNFIYTQDNHTSVLGMRELVKDKSKIACITTKKLSQMFSQTSSNQFEFDPNRIKPVQNKLESNSLFVYSAQCNFSGIKYPLQWIEQVQNGGLDNMAEVKNSKWYVLLDAAAYCATNELNLSQFKPDFVCLSFYKMFGYPTGIGALLVRNQSSDVLEKRYYGGGTVNISLSLTMFHVKRSNLCERFEDGTIPFTSIIALQAGLKIISNIGINTISNHVFSLAKYLHHSLKALHHHNNHPVIKLYADTDYENCQLQGGIVTFNVLRSNGDYVGYMEVLNMAALYKVHLRTGCFCNPGACQRHLQLTNDEILENYDAGYVCGGTRDLINGRPTGAVRISFGYMSTISEVRTVLRMIQDCFMDSSEVSRIQNGVQSTVPNEPKIIKDHFKNGINLKNRNKQSKIQLKHLFIYPIKSCAAFEIKNSWQLNSRGLKYDREWMVVTSVGVCLTQKQEVKLCLIKPIINLEKQELILSYPGMPDISLPLKNEATKVEQNEICRSKICGHKVEGLDCGSYVSEWLSLALKRPKLRLIRQSANENESNDSNKKELSFVSQAQYLLVNEASVLWLANQIAEDRDFQRSTMLQRFRANICVSGYEPFEETSWSCVNIGNNAFQVEGPCTRCQMICIDQTTGEKTVEPLRTLASELSGKIRFGIYLSRKSNSEMTLNIGEEIRIS